MDIRIKEVSLKNFKGAKETVIKFDGKDARLLGCNGAGKTTIADAFYWVFADCNTAMVKNPSITPMGSEECESIVDITFEYDGKPLTASKSQKYKTKLTDGKTTSSVTNTYQINGVEKSYRDFVANLTERGFDMDNFLVFSNPAAFTADTSKSGRDRMRALLFKMCEGYSDADVAGSMNDINELKALLSSYKLDEIEQMNKATIKKVNDSMGKDNSIVNARIDELTSQKSTLDIKVLESQKSQYEAEISRIDKTIEDLSGNKADISDKYYGLKNRRDAYIHEANQKLYKQKVEFDGAIRTLMAETNEKTLAYKQNMAEIDRIKAVIADKTSNLEKTRFMYKEAQALVMDDDALICPVCKREYEESKISEIKADFENEKSKRLKTLEATGKALQKALDENETSLKALMDKEDSLRKLMEEAENKLEEVKSEAMALPQSADLTNDKEYAALIDEIATLESQLNTSDNDRIAELKSQRNVNTQMLNQVIAEIGVLDKNKDIDNRISELREQRMIAEIKKADAEKILDQVDKFKKAKNDRLTEKINSYFNVAKFRLFKLLKNGNVEDALDVLIDGKEIISQANQSLQVIAKLDIIKGLSDYFEMWMPVFADDYALITSDSDARIDMKNQLIKLVASDDAKELTVERG